MNLCMSEALKQAIAEAGGQTALARLLNVDQAHVWYWLHKAKRIPVERAIQIEQATGGKVTRHDLRPDIFPPPHPDEAA